MSEAKIFLHQKEEDSLIELKETEWLRERDLQKFLVKYPDLLPGNQIDPDSPRNWFLVSREMSVPSEEGEKGWWSLDHLFLDQDGIPTFVECKQSSDTRARREVVAQMMDYAANASKYWSVERIRQVASERASQQDSSLDEVITEFLDTEEESVVEEFWKKVEMNLEENSIRLLFVINEVPKELRRIVEFLNEEMKHVEVLAVEIKRFKENIEGRAVLVPRVIGLTEKIKENKKSSTTSQSPTSKSEFLNKCNPTSQQFFENLLKKVREKNYKIRWGTVGFSVRAQIAEDEYGSFIHCYPPNKFHFYFGKWLRENDEIDDNNLRKNLLNYGVFEEGGDWTLKTEVVEDNIEETNEVYEFILDKVESLLKNQ